MPVQTVNVLVWPSGHGPSQSSVFVFPQKVCGSLEVKDLSVTAPAVYTTAVEAVGWHPALAA